ncbi:MAG: hypothetical protein PHW26_05405, partial [Eubacteriales bacterium]|nr:hypothetical protein [Eubacteriales bacterium]
ADYYNLLGHLAAIASDGRDIMTKLLYQEMFIRDNSVVVVSSHRGARLERVLRHLSVRGNSVTLVLVNGKSEESSALPRREGLFTEIVIDKAEDLIPAAKKEVN